MLTCRLFEVVVENNVLRGRQVLCHGSDVTARHPVGTQDGIVADICPEHSFLEADSTASFNIRIEQNRCIYRINVFLEAFIETY